MKIKMPIKTVSESNQREHWAVKHKRRKQQRRDAYLLMPKVPKPDRIKLTRIAPRKLDTDNNVSAFKAIRDSIAEKLEFDDGDASVIWEYDQRRGKPNEYAVIVEVTNGLG